MLFLSLLAELLRQRRGPALFLVFEFVVALFGLGEHLEEVDHASAASKHDYNGEGESNERQDVVGLAPTFAVRSWGLTHNDYRSLSLLLFLCLIQDVLLCVLVRFDASVLVIG